MCLAAGLLAFSLNQTGWSYFSLADIALYGALGISAGIIKNVFQNQKAAFENATALLAILPFATSMFLVTSILLLFSGEDFVEWHGHFSSVRMYDDALLPCLFLLWQRTGFLARKPITLIVYFLSFIFCLLFTVFYLLSLFVVRWRTCGNDFYFCSVN